MSGGNAGNNMLNDVGGGGDELSGLGGKDTLTGSGDDFLFSKGFGKDVITDFEIGVDSDFVVLGA